MNLPNKVEALSIAVNTCRRRAPHGKSWYRHAHVLAFNGISMCTSCAYVHGASIEHSGQSHRQPSYPYAKAAAACLLSTIVRMACSIVNDGS